MAPDSAVSQLPRGPHRLTRQQVTASQRGRMLDAMIRAVADKGYARCSVADVIARAGVSRATFYEHFTDKEDCFLAAYDASVQVLLGQLTGPDAGAGAGAGAVAGAPPGAGEGLSAAGFADLLDRYLAAIAAEPVVARTFLIEVYSAGPAALARRYAVLERFVDLLSDVFAEAPDWPSDPVDHRLRCEAIVGALSSMVTTRIARGDVASLPALRDPILALVGLV